MILDIFGEIYFSGQQKLFITGFIALCCVLAVALFCALFFTVRYLIRKSEKQAVIDRQNAKTVTGAIRRKKRLIALYTTGFCVTLTLFALMLVLSLATDIDIFDYEWVIIVFCINAIALLLFSIAVFGGMNSSSEISDLKEQIKELNRLKDTGKFNGETAPLISQTPPPLQRENSTNRKGKTRETGKMLFWGFLAMALIILLILNFKWIIYGIYYKPLYALFGGNVYLPFYLYIVNVCLRLLVIALVFAGYLWANERMKPRIIGSTVFGLIFILGAYFSGKDIYRDIVFIGKEKYLKTECRIISLYKQRSKINRYFIYGTEKVNGKDIRIEMNFYQYAELSKIKEEQDKINRDIGRNFYYPRTEPVDSIITVYYLPNTERMLKHE